MSWHEVALTSRWHRDPCSKCLETETPLTPVSLAETNSIAHMARTVAVAVVEKLALSFVHFIIVFLVPGLWLSEGPTRGMLTTF